MFIDPHITLGPVNLYNCKLPIYNFKESLAALLFQSGRSKGEPSTPQITNRDRKKASVEGGESSECHQQNLRRHRKGVDEQIKVVRDDGSHSVA